MMRRRPRPDAPPPIGIVVVAIVGIAAFLLPLLGLAWRAPWSGAIDVLRDHYVLEALRLSLVSSLSATVLAVVVGTPIAWVLARTRFPFQSVVRALMTLPMVLPPVVGGVALLYAFGRLGLVGQWLDSWFGVRLAFTTSGVVIAETFVSMPFLIVTMEAALRSVDGRLEDAARTLRASRWQVFRTVTLPIVRPSLIAGAVLCWARALGEFGATITFAGNLPGTTQTMPLKVYLALESGQPEDAIVLSLVLVAVSLATLVALRSHWLLSRALRPAD